MEEGSTRIFDDVQPRSVLDLAKLARNGTAIRAALRTGALGSVSRRDFIKAGSATLAAAASYEPSVHRLAGRLRLVHTAGRASLQVDNRDAFVVNAESFTGSPRIAVERSGSRYSIWLESAGIAGSDSRADLHLELWEGLLGWQYRLNLSHLGLLFRGDLAEWLLDGSGSPTQAQAFQFYSRAFDVESPADQTVNLFPDWKFNIEGARLRTRVGAQLLDVASAVLQLPQSGYETILRGAGGPAALLHLTRGANRWPIEARLPGCDYGFEFGDECFDTLRVETVEREHVESALLAEDRSNIASVRAVPVSAFEGADGIPMSLRLTNIRYAAGLDDLSEYFSGDIAGGSLSLPGLSVGFGNSGDAPGFQVAAAGGTSATSCQPAVTLRPQLPGALSETSEIPGAASLPLTWGNFWCKVGRFLQLDSEARKACLNPGNLPLVIKIVRPQDFVNLVFEFRGIQFNCDKGDSSLTPQSDPSNAFVVVHFPPQHIFEQCFKAQDASCGPAVITDPFTRPVQTRISGESRLVFRPFTNHVTELDFTLEKLLDWSSWELVVNPVAASPVDLHGRFTPDGRIETDFICDFINATIVDIDAQKVVRIDRQSLPKYTRLETVDARTGVPIAPITLDDVQFLSPTRLKVTDVTHLHPGQDCVLSVPCEALKDPPPAPAPDGPGELESAIELPYRLIISPNEHGQFQTSKTPDPDSPQRIELWHSRLKSYSEIEVNDPESKRWQAIRAVWSPDVKSAVDPFSPTCQPMTSDDRKALVASSTTFNGKTSRGEWFNPFAMPVKTLALSAMGGWLDGKVAWEPLGSTVTNQCFDLEGWEQRTAAARDNLVKLQYKGFLIPTGHRCILEKSTQREWYVDSDGNWVAALVQRCQLIFQRPRKTYPAVGQLFNSRDFPFASATITIPKSPYLDEDCNDPPYLVPHVCKKWFAIPLELVDLEGHTVKCELPMVYVSNCTVFDAAHVADLRKALDAFAPANCDVTKLQATQMRQQKIAYAPPGKPGDTSYATNSLVWCYSTPDTTSANQRKRFDQPGWYPSIKQGSIQLGSVQVFSSRDTPASVSFADAYVKNGFPPPQEPGAAKPPANGGEAFLHVEGASPSFAFPGEKGAGIILPSVDVTGVSRKLGVLGGDIQKAVDNHFNPLDFFPDNVTLLGAIKLRDVIAAVLAISGLSDRVPKLVQQELHDLEKQLSEVKATVQQHVIAAYNSIHELKNYTDQITTRLAELGQDAQHQNLVKNALTTLLNLLGDGKTLTEYQEKASQAVTQLNDLPHLREYFIQNLGAAATATQTDVEALRTEFSQVGQDKVRALTGAFDKARGNLAQAAPFLLSEAITELQNGLNNSDLNAVLQALRDFTGGLDQVLATASAFLAMIDQARAVTADLQQQLTAAQKQVHDSLQDLIAEANDAKWKLQDQAKQTVINQLHSFQNQADAALKPLVDNVKAFQTKLQTYIDSTLTQARDTIDAKLAEIENVIVEQVLSALDLPTGIRVNYDFSPQLQDAPAGDPLFKAARGDSSAKLDIHCFVEKRFDGRATTSQVDVKLTDFELHLFPFAPFIVLPVRQLTMVSTNGGKPVVTTDIDTGSVQLLGPLNFVEQLQKYLHFGDISIVPSATDVRAVAAINLPNISIGAFNLEHVSFNSSLILWFTGDPVTFRFAFAERSRPCLLSFGIFGGTCFAALELRSSSDFVKIEAALDFGAVAALDLGVASGEVHIFGGFYFKTEPHHLILQGYIRAGGELSILDIVSMSVEFFLGLAYENRAGKAWLVGECTVTVEIHVLFFSASVGLTLRKEFSGGGESTAELVLPGGESSEWAALGSSDPRIARLLVSSDEPTPSSNKECKSYGNEWQDVYREQYRSYAW